MEWRKTAALTRGRQKGKARIGGRDVFQRKTCQNFDGGEKKTCQSMHLYIKEADFHL